MAVLDHHVHLEPAKQTHCFWAVCNVALVFVGILVLAYIFSLFI